MYLQRVDAFFVISFFKKVFVFIVVVAVKAVDGVNGDVWCCW